MQRPCARKYCIARQELQNRQRTRHPVQTIICEPYYSGGADGGGKSTYYPHIVWKGSELPHRPVEAGSGKHRNSCQGGGQEIGEEFPKPGSRDLKIVPQYKRYKRREHHQGHVSD